MKRRRDEIWNLAKPYLDTRNNEIHTRIAAMFAEKLLKKEGGDEDIVIPAIILHDVGWKMIPEDQQLKAFGPKVVSTGLVKKHETESVRIAGEILEKVNYDREKTHEILETIDGHDSRKGALSLNDRIVRDADKLWRFSKEGFNIDCKRFNLKPIERAKARDVDIDRILFTESAKQIAREEMENRLKESKIDKKLLDLF